MRFRNFIGITLFLFLAFSSLSAQEDYWLSTYVQNPRNWNSAETIIEDMSVIVEPQGAYANIDLTMSLSTDFDRFEVNDSLEIIFDFLLPKGSIVRDSWLWIGEDIIRAELLDRWTATEIYEEIVGRNQDPSLLTHDRNGEYHSYQLRIFPLTRQDHARKFRISYLVPTQWNDTDVKINLPIPLLKIYNPNLPVDITINTNETWGKPSLIQYPDFLLNPGEDGNYEFIYTGEELDVSFEAPYDEQGIYFSIMEGESEDFYQLAILPSKAFNLSEVSKRTVILIDYVEDNTNYSKQALIAELQNLLHDNYSSNDSFQVFLSNIDIRPLQPDWMSGDDMNITNLSDPSRLSQISSYSNLYQLIASAIRYINAEEVNANILIVSNAGRYGSQNEIDSRVEDFIGLMENRIPVHILDYQSRNLSSLYANSISYRGNSYFYNTLASATNGDYSSVHFDGSQSFEDLFKRSAVLGQKIDVFDIFTGAQGGISYDRISPLNDGNTYINRPVFQIGKYNGDFPFTITAGGVLGATSFGNTFRIDEQLIESTPTLAQMWAGYKIDQLEDSYASADIQQVLEWSLDYRVLSQRTAFLALEPGQGGEICEECDEDDSTVEVEEIWSDEAISIKVLPNPFREQVTIQLQLAEELDIADAQFIITDAQGRVLKSFKEGEWELVNGIYEFIWNGTDATGKTLPSGIYFFSILTKEGEKSVKLMKQIKVD